MIALAGYVITLTLIIVVAAWRRRTHRDKALADAASMRRLREELARYG